MKPISCLPYKILCLALIAGIVLAYLYYAVGCTLRGRIDLSEDITVYIKEYTDKPGGTIITRALDVWTGKKLLRRVWCPPAPRPPGLLSSFQVALCKGESTEYVVINDEDLFWIVS